ncbi:beta-ketoacyl-ACP synthase II [Rickettsia prowazekii]|uniref:3-oxoacyl-[acyl-carrier-protein] synthase 2 n=2 Tax=Rickettsia prowazekii TaxID=782 RepID=Q9ZCH8_RICPR|nr:beta-ketoacyl-ACP synthase II [Rickettsia prowazekii]EOB10314.1 Guanylate kinase [Rickettsia prowazekii str. GvF12]ADE30327.1 3-oxoacyl-(acyl carrier protein) synthase II [Rickettsia prowazekii str. Rp22]AFE49561.1 3-oxoacyl-(acyl carrier protein) synthase II [Rickettsia prowazekii str. Chernikova]AFE50405.1 3-oxoacyl-(acyl carrier protein) synthase II [Rickettsia prowazekii str. Katsinyian]AFE51249.1 3-oxoacyl-(acyl carrier protein) synthase II [Rickettsia prowazekii str. BuV67-CWPP]
MSNQNINKRVVITGLGLVTPVGLNVSSTWKNIVGGVSGIKTITEFDTSKLACKIAGVIDNSEQNGFKLENFTQADDINRLSKMDKFIHYGIAAATEAVEDSGWLPKDEKSRDRTGLILGSGIGGLKMIEDTSIKLYKENNGKVSPFFIPASLINLLSGLVSIKYGFSGPNQAAVTACSTGAHAIGDAMRMIKHGYADVMIAGGAEAPVTPVGIAGFVAARALCTKYNDNPEKASRPWDKDRSGFVMGEGAGIVVLEEYEHAINRGAKIYCEVIGYGSTGDAYHMTAPHPKGRGAYRAMSEALQDADITPSMIDYINAHGTSTPLGDMIELDATQKLFLESNPKILMSSTKSSIGHLLGAAGSVEFIFSVLTIRDQIAPPTLNLENPIDDVKIDLVKFKARETVIDYVLSNSFGFGGTNASLVIKKI